MWVQLFSYLYIPPQINETNLLLLKLKCQRAIWDELMQKAGWHCGLHWETDRLKSPELYLSRGQHDTLSKLTGSPSGAKLRVNVCREAFSGTLSPHVGLQFLQMKLLSDCLLCSSAEKVAKGRAELGGKFVGAVVIIALAFLMRLRRWAFLWNSIL